MARRDLTPGETKLGKYVFGHSINLANVKVRKAPRKGHTAITPFGSISFPKADYRADFIGPNMRNPVDEGDAHWFLHELAHVWQHYVGLRVMARAVKEWLKSKGKYNQAYGFTIQASKDLLEYNLEQQGDIIANYFAWELGWPSWTGLTGTSDYKGVLANFLNDRKYPVKGHPWRRFRARVRGLHRE
jgi:hypothetical protein